MEQEKLLTKAEPTVEDMELMASIGYRPIIAGGKITGYEESGDAE